MAETDKSIFGANVDNKNYKMEQLAIRLKGTSTSPRHIDLLDPDTWEEYKEHEEDLFLLLKEEFANCSPDMFGKINCPFKKIIRDYFHNNGARRQQLLVLQSFTCLMLKSFQNGLENRAIYARSTILITAVKLSPTINSPPVKTRTIPLHKYTEI
ncbi:hypothetical protein GcM1_197024 [Golovinomyces cichoracearum]|uniref:Uncharacterized protein n=1 Tax=Golovinomyces cichoracearum TaxID=62708 RepID=A0A420IZU0_9PEZI|nr:hypothetical protein GcM1_197024 [Golovinomyces cichoracearum]